MNAQDPKNTLKIIRTYLVIFLLGILFSLHTVLFVEVETAFFNKHFGPGTAMEQKLPAVSSWIETLYTNVHQTYKNYPVMAYCMDSLSYACVIFAIFMIGAIKDPVKNLWIIQTFLIACVLVTALPFIAGPFRGVPIFWRCLDSSFAVIGFFVLLIPYKLTKKLIRVNGGPE